MKILAKVFSHDRERRTWIIASWTVFALAVAVIIVGSFLIFRGHGAGTDQAEELEPALYRQSTLLMAVVSNILVMVNTVFFVVQLMIVFWTRIPRDGNRKGLVQLSVWLLGGYIAAIACSLIIIVTFVDKARGLSVLSWGDVYDRNKWLSLAIFAIFFAADVMLYKLVDESVDVSPTVRGDGPLLEFIRKQLLYIDFPGFVGVLIIAAIAHLYDWFGVMAPGYNPNGVYIEGFSVGAIAMQVMFTQMNFAMLNGQSDALPQQAKA